MKINKILTVAMCLISSWSIAQSGDQDVFTKEQQMVVEAADEEGKKRNKASKEAYFANRSETPGSDVATNEQNIPAKKETFTQMLDRYKAQGFKIAVQLESPSISRLLHSEMGTTKVTNYRLGGNLPSMQPELEPLVVSLAAKLNKEFNTDLFEVVDIQKIPIKNSFFITDKWGATKYKMVIKYKVFISYYYYEIDRNYIAKFNAISAIDAKEYIYDKKKESKSKSRYISSMKDYNFIYEQDSKLDILTLKELDSIVKPPKGDELLGILQQKQDVFFPKMIKKLRK